MTHFNDYSDETTIIAPPAKAPYRLSHKEALRREAARQFVLGSLDEQLGDHQAAQYARRDADTLTKILFDQWGI